MSEYRFRQLDQEWERTQAAPLERSRFNFAMTLQWRRMGEHYAPTGNTLHVRNWRAFNTYLATRLRVLARAQELERAIEEAQ